MSCVLLAIAIALGAMPAHEYSYPDMADHYQTLGVEPDADLTIIKRRYRLLVRENHPDAVEASRRQSAHERMLEINAAWTILSDPAERARYDRSRMPVVVPPSSSERAAQASRGAQSSTSTHGAAPRNASARSASSSRASGRSRTSARGANPRTRLLTMVFEAAELYFFHGRAQEAIEMCNRVMQFDPRNAEAPALLGDIYAEQGRKDVAVLMYERAVRNQPDNALYRQKWEQLKSATSSASASASRSPNAGGSAVTGGSAVRSGSGGGGASNGPMSGSGPRYGPNANRAKYNVSERIAQSEGAQSEGAARQASAVQTNGSAATPFARVVSSSGATVAGAASANVASGTVSSRTVVPPNLGANATSGAKRAASDRPHMAGGFALAAIATALVVWGNLELTPGAGIVVEPTFQQLLLTSAAGAGLGAALPLLNLVKGCGQVRRGAPAFTGAPLVFCMALAGAVMFPLAWLLYLLTSMAWRLWHRSLLTVLTVALCLSATMIAAAPPGQASENTMNLVQSVLIFWSGRAILPSVIGGWALGSMLRRR